MTATSTDLAGSTETLAAFAVDTSFDDLPTSCVAAAQRVILDALGCAVGGHRVPSAEIVRRQRVAWGGAAESSLLVDGTRLPCPAAAAVNAHAANALDAEHLQKVEQVQLVRQRHVWALELDGKGDLTMEQMAASARADLFATPSGIRDGEGTGR